MSTIPGEDQLAQFDEWMEIGKRVFNKPISFELENVQGQGCLYITFYLMRHSTEKDVNRINNAVRDILSEMDNAFYQTYNDNALIIALPHQTKNILREHTSESINLKEVILKVIYEVQSAEIKSLIKPFDLFTTLSNLINENKIILMMWISKLNLSKL